MRLFNISRTALVTYDTPVNLTLSRTDLLVNPTGDGDRPTAVRLDTDVTRVYRDGTHFHIGGSLLLGASLLDYRKEDSHA